MQFYLICMGKKKRQFLNWGWRGRGRDIDIKLNSPIVFWHLRGKRIKPTGAPALATALDVMFLVATTECEHQK